MIELKMPIENMVNLLSSQKGELSSWEFSLLAYYHNDRDLKEMKS
jgi:hypothetical protein